MSTPSIIFARVLQRYYITDALEFSARDPTDVPVEWTYIIIIIIIISIEVN